MMKSANMNMLSNMCPAISLSSGTYSMSQPPRTDASKAYFYVKLTDSAIRALEEYNENIRNRQLASHQRATIQFEGGAGVMQFPLPLNNANSGGGGGGGNKFSSSEHAGERRFGFAIDENEGSLECIQQHPNKQLDVLGPVAGRIRIKANDDVYHATRTKMAIAEETEKSKCVREIKPNTTGIGRRVVKPAVSAALATTPLEAGRHSNSSQRTTSSGGGGSLSGLLSNKLPNSTLERSSHASNGGGGGGSNGGSSSVAYNDHHGRFTKTGSTTSGATATATASMSKTGGINAKVNLPIRSTSSSSAVAPTRYDNFKPSSAAKNSAALANSRTNDAKSSSGGGSNNNTSSKSAKGSTAAGGNKSNPYMRCKLRDRLIHLLALRPFKKPEIYVRLSTEGIRDRDRNLIPTVLREISTLFSDNTFHLKHAMWNEVDENWPLFTQQELQQLRRRKPQNLTPPNSSDACSNASGQSPASTHTASPPQPSGVESTSLATAAAAKRRAESNADEASCDHHVPPRKQRISHFNKDGSACSPGDRYRTTSGGRGSSGQSVSRNNSNSMSAKRQMTAMTKSATTAADGDTRQNERASGDLSYGVLKNVDFLQRFEQNATMGTTTNPLKSSAKSDEGRRSTPTHATNISNSSSSKPPTKSSYAKSFIRESRSTTNDNATSPGGDNVPAYSNRLQAVSHPPQQEPTDNLDATTHAQAARTQYSSHHPEKISNQPPHEQSQHQFDHQHQQDHSHLAQHIDHPPAEATTAQAPTPSSYNSSNYGMECDNSNTTPKRYDFSYFKPITTVEERRAYRQEYQRGFDEHNVLAPRVNSIQNIFNQFEIRLKEAEQNDPDECERVKNYISAEYEKLPIDQFVIERDRFSYLHAKLVYIKKLVDDYDEAVAAAAEAARQQLEQEREQKLLLQSQQYEQYEREHQQLLLEQEHRRQLQLQQQQQQLQQQREEAERQQQQQQQQQQYYMNQRQQEELEQQRQQQWQQYQQQELYMSHMRQQQQQQQQQYESYNLANDSSCDEGGECEEDSDAGQRVMNATSHQHQHQQLYGDVHHQQQQQQYLHHNPYQQHQPQDHGN